MDYTGLSSKDTQGYLDAHGYNEIIEKKDSLIVRIAKKSFSFISGMLFLASVLSFASGKDFDGTFIIILLVINVAISVWQEHKADTAIEKLNERLAIEVKVLRDGTWQKVASRLLVPKDVMELRSGSIIPADAKILDAKNVSANEAALTGESLPKEKNVGDELYSGSFVASGLVVAEVVATGSGTRFGKTLTKIEGAAKRSSLEREILNISRYLSALSLAAVMLLSWALYYEHAPLVEILRLDLSLIIAGIPISLPTVMTLIIAFGTVALAQKSVIVRRLSSLEDLANTNLLLTDKTGTLTENSIHVDEVISYTQEEKPEDISRLAAWTMSPEPDEIIAQAILEKAGEIHPPKIDEFIPGDSTRKRSTARLSESGQEYTLSVGAPQVVASLCALDKNTHNTFTLDVERLAARGYRTVALARAKGKEEKEMQFLGLITLSDELRPDAKDVITFLGENSIDVAMVTGDNRAIAKEIADKLAIPGNKVITHGELEQNGFNAMTAQSFKDAQAFAEFLPEDKLSLINSAKRYYTVAANGDGVNDLPAIKAADVGFAVKNAVEALKGAADIVLLTDGIAVMRDAFIEGRKIFARLYSYSLYRISESVRLIVTIALLGLLTGTYPLSPLQLILLALLNDIPIISLATDRVRIARRPSSINLREQLTVSSLFGLVGVTESLLLFYIAMAIFHLPIALVQTVFFLKLTVSGHLLIYVAHTKERWWKFLPSSAVILATALTQAVATLFAITGLFMPAAIPWQYAVAVWIWTLLFMQLAEAVKFFSRE